MGTTTLPIPIQGQVAVQITVSVSVTLTMNYMPQYADINSVESLALWQPFQVSMQSVMVQQLPGFQMISLTTITQTTIVANIGRRRRRQAAAEDGIAIGFDTIFNAQKVIDAIESGDMTSNMTI